MAKKPFLRERIKSEIHQGELTLLLYFVQVISIRYSSRVTRSDRGWSHRRIAIEDPCSPKWNLCKPMNSQV